MLTNRTLRIRINYDLRELSPIPCQRLMDDKMTIEGILERYQPHVQLFDTIYASPSSFDDTKRSSLNPLKEIYRPLDEIENISKNDKYSIICTHGLNIASINLKFSEERIDRLSTSNEVTGSSLGSYCYTLRI